MDLILIWEFIGSRDHDRSHHSRRHLLCPPGERGLALGTAVSTSGGLLAPYVMGSLIENAATPLEGFNTGFIICGVIMLVGGAIGMALIRPEREATRWASEMPEAAV